MSAVFFYFAIVWNRGYTVMIFERKFKGDNERIARAEGQEGFSSYHQTHDTEIISSLSQLTL